MDLAEHIAAGTASVGVVGLGYVGLPLAVAFAKAGMPVVAVDIDQGRADAINEGRSPVHVTLERDQLADIAPGAQRGPQISEREQAVLRLLASGVTTSEVGRQLDYSESTVKRTIRNVFEKMGVRNRSEAVARHVIFRDRHFGTTIEVRVDRIEVNTEIDSSMFTPSAMGLK